MNTIIGFILGALASMVSTIFYERYKEHRTRKTMAVAISQEIQSLYELAKEKKLDDFLKDDPNKTTVITFTANYNYFTVYESNSNLIALFEQEVSLEIVRFYNRVRAMLEDIKIYSDRVVQTGSASYNTIIELRKSMQRQYEQILEQKDKVIELLNKENEKKFLWLLS